MYDLEKIPLPLHPMPSPSAPPISYAHTCINDNHAAEQRDIQFDVGGTLFKHSDSGEFAGPACVPMVINRTRPEFNNSAESYIEIIQNETKVLHSTQSVPLSCRSSCSHSMKRSRRLPLILLCVPSSSVKNFGPTSK